MTHLWEFTLDNQVILGKQMRESELSAPEGKHLILRRTKSAMGFRGDFRFIVALLYLLNVKARSGQAST